jgi:hypothetical protein
MELQHLSHKHPLNFNEDLPRSTNDIIDIYPYNCHLCWKQVSGPNYSCKECSWFVLHKSCAELPRKLRHPLHRKHPLLLSAVHDWFESECEGCNTGALACFHYSCFDCKFYLHINCASMPLTIQAESHAHPLTLVRRSVSFTCDACGKEGKGMFYLCAVCPFLVHLECASFPLTVKHIRHTHPLNLTNSLEVHQFQSDHRLCELCVKIVDIDYMLYYCSACDYVNHLHCATNKQLEDTEVGLDETIDSFPYVVLKSKVGEDKMEKAVEIKHFSHEHDLELIDEQLENKEKCDACVSSISLPFYSCVQCRFFLHKSCVELPKKKSHSLHRHTLILLPERPNARSFDCDACNRTCNGFTYCCDKCDFDLDVHCSLIPDIINHDGHEHQLILSSKYTSYLDKCSSCDFHRKVLFRCADCEFTLDFKCATLPRTIRYGPYEQSFVLCYKDEDSSSNEYFCDICEEERDPKKWFYYCADLNFSAHPDCILGELSYVKSMRHEHPLKLVDKSKVADRLCDECGSLCYGLTYKCINCNFNLHNWCIHKTTEQTRLGKFAGHA